MDLPVPSFLLFSLLLHFISLSLSLSHSLFRSVSVTFLFLVNQFKWKANGSGSRFPGSPALSLLS